MTIEQLTCKSISTEQKLLREHKYCISYCSYPFTHHTFSDKFIQV